MTTPKLRLENLSMTFSSESGDFVALAPVDLDIAAGRFVSLIGPSGCGKTTIFNVVAGLLAPTTGRVLIDGEDATGLIGQVGYMLQKDLLLPWRTVLDNIALGLEIKGVPMNGGACSCAAAHSALRPWRLRTSASVRAVGRHATARSAAAAPCSLIW